jgi:hypothetical protein
MMRELSLGADELEGAAAFVDRAVDQAQALAKTATELGRR